MNLKNSSTALFVRDIEISKQFYSDVLGLTIDLDFGKNVIYKNGFAIWEIRDTHIIPSKL
jgi:catechol 2,3-dioxygenase-like lactoylglutathione lyase family enzyme